MCPLEIESAGLHPVGTYLHCRLVVLSRILLTRFSTKTFFFDVVSNQYRLVVLSLQYTKSSFVTALYEEEIDRLNSTPARHAQSSSLGMVEVAPFLGATRAFASTKRTDGRPLMYWERQ